MSQSQWGLPDLFKNKISSEGTAISFTKSGQTVSEVWKISMISTSQAKNYLDDIEYMAVIKPALEVMAPYDTQIEENLTFQFDSRTFTARKIFNYYDKDDIIYKTFIAY